MNKKLEILKRSLAKKEQLLNAKYEAHFASVKQANGQPLNDKKNGQATLSRWEKQSDGIRALQKSIEKTKSAIQVKENRVKAIEHANASIPAEIQMLVESGELIQWKKHPNIFFVAGVEKARIVWDANRKLVAHCYTNEIATQEQRTKFVRIYNLLNEQLNKR